MPPCMRPGPIRPGSERGRGRADRGHHAARQADREAGSARRAAEAGLRRDEGQIAFESFFAPLPDDELDLRGEIEAVRHALIWRPSGLENPVDRMLIAQALSEDLILVSDETRFDAFGVRRLW
jgi:hypothetical protein